MEEYRTLIFRFEHACDPLWTEQGYPISVEEMKTLGLSDELVERIGNLSSWHYSHLNPVYQMLPSLWQRNVCDAFNREANAVFETVVNAIPHVEIVKNFGAYEEDPELYEYLERPIQFYRRKGISHSQL